MMANLRIEALCNHSPKPILSPQSVGTSLANGGISMHNVGAVQAWNHEGSRDAQENGKEQRLKKMASRRQKQKNSKANLDVET
jgi:hypothetical protein